MYVLKNIHNLTVYLCNIYNYLRITYNQGLILLLWDLILIQNYSNRLLNRLKQKRCQALNAQHLKSMIIFSYYNLFELISSVNSRLYL